ncbi:ParA family protein [Leifsonia sp. H3M29-4]|jgi:chromosome partitioning protein|uniref:ParA family protein n=1 Tax=Salinibacterium metalliresistens TaxID=3031321 RepID=UPI0023DA9B98|nr:ParA family protein [Salinibacterium metalliresistens]MDF1480355.1 ParA family protein [Salinibacterium metalliresistens]
MTIRRSVAFAQGKGGVGKTSITSNVGGLAAAAGYRVLIVDLDQQGNTARDLGFEPDPGTELLKALAFDDALPVRRGVRERLDVVPGGPDLGDVSRLFSGNATRGDLADKLEEKLAPIAGDYDLILIDTPPGDRIIVEGALGISSAVAIPTRMDEASIDGVSRIAERFIAVRERNPRLRLAGIILFAIASRTTRLERDVRDALQQILGDAAPVFETRIRHLDSAAADSRRRGLLVHELEAAAVDDKAARLKVLQLARGIPGEAERREMVAKQTAGGLYSTNSAGLAEDYEALTRELLVRIQELEAGEAA